MLRATELFFQICKKVSLDFTGLYSFLYSRSLPFTKILSVLRMVYFRISCYETKRKVEFWVIKTNYISTIKRLYDCTLLILLSFSFMEIMVIFKNISKFLFCGIQKYECDIAAARRLFSSVRSWPSRSVDQEENRITLLGKIQI